jgi:Zn-dependent peptidase ImmA (M78 family)
MFEKRMSYVNAYKALVERLAEDRIFVLDKSRGWSLNTDKSWSWVFIDSSLGRRRRLFMLAHMAGHLFCYPKGGTIRRTVTKLRSEDRANEFAIRICKELLKMDVTPYYMQFKKSIKTRKKYLKKSYGGQNLCEVREYSSPPCYDYDSFDEYCE